MFPGVTMEFSNDFGLLESEVGRHFPAPEGQFPPAGGGVDRLRPVRPAGGGAIGPRGRRQPDRRSAAGRDAVLPGAVLRRRAGARHGLRPVQHPVPLDLPGGVGPAAGGRAADPEAAAAEVLRPGRRVAAALRASARILVKDGRADASCSKTAASWQPDNVLSSAGWPETMRLCDEAVPRAAARRRAVDRRVDLGPEPAAAGPGPRPDHGLLQRFGEVSLRETRRGRRPPQRHRLLAQQLPLRRAAAWTASCGSRCWATTTAGRRWTSRPTGGKSAAGTSAWSPRPCASSPISATPWSRPTCSPPSRSAALPATTRGPFSAPPEKRYDGTTHLRNLFVCGNDQGLVGIIGTILSGISIANRYLLQG